MKLLAFADFHGNINSAKLASNLISVESPNVIVVAGDLANRDMEGAEQILLELSRFSSRVLFVPGNMDEPTLADWKDDSRAFCLHGKGTAQGDAWFVGLGGRRGKSFRSSV